MLDTSVFISAVFFSGLPYRILDAWHKGKVRLFVSRVILAEYHETGAARAHIIRSGDKALLRTSGCRGIEVLKPREFADRYLPQT